MSIRLRVVPSGTLVCTGEDVFHQYGHLTIDDLEEQSEAEFSSALH